MSDRYPEAVWKGDGRKYGSLTAKYPHAVILHTTETTAVPGYNNGSSSPTFTYDAPRYRTIQHQSADAWVGTLRAGSGPISANAKARQIEIVCYSDKGVADQSSSRLWVGDLDDRQLNDIANILRWLRNTDRLPSLTVYQPAASWRYGSASPYRMTWTQYLAFDGVTAHGAVPDNTHWNTGALDIRALVARVSGPGGDDEMTLKRGARGNAVGKFQRALNAWRPSLGLSLDGIFGPATESAVSQYQGAADLVRSGAIDGVTAALLLEYLPDEAGGTPQPPPPPAPPATKQYVVQRGDTFNKIAAAHGLTHLQLRALNPHVTNPDLLRIGDVLNVPA